MQQIQALVTTRTSHPNEEAPKRKVQDSPGGSPTFSSAEEDIKVVHRDGSRTPLNIAKIRSVVEWACDNLDVNSITLEAGLTTRLKNGVTTREIQDNLIDCALSMCSPSEPDWRYVAGRLHIWNLWKDIQVARKDRENLTSPLYEGYGYRNYPKTVRLQVEQGRYDRAILQSQVLGLILNGIKIMIMQGLSY
jgi:ribonucleoside-diphosphate reductase alpha chain